MCREGENAAVGPPRRLQCAALTSATSGSQQQKRRAWSGLQGHPGPQRPPSDQLTGLHVAVGLSFPQEDFGAAGLTVRSTCTACVPSTLHWYLVYFYF